MPARTMTALDVEEALQQLQDDLERVVTKLTDYDDDATGKRRRYEVAFARALVEADAKSKEVREAQATLATESEREALDVADHLVRMTRERMKATYTKIEIARSIGASIRSSMQ